MIKAYFEKRLTVCNVPMIYRKRVHKNNGYRVVSGDCFNSIHFGKRSLIVQKLVSPKRTIKNTFTWSNNI